MFVSVIAELCNKVISHCHKWIDSFISSENGGSLQQYKDLNTLIKVPTKEIKYDDIGTYNELDVEEDEREKEEE